MQAGRCIQTPVLKYPSPDNETKRSDKILPINMPDSTQISKSRIIERRRQSIDIKDLLISIYVNVWINSADR